MNRCGAAVPARSFATTAVVVNGLAALHSAGLRINCSYSNACSGCLMDYMDNVDASQLFLGM